MDNINLKSEKFKSDLYKLVNNSGLPIVNIYYIFQMAFKDIENLYCETINKLWEQANKKEEEQSQIKEENV